MSGFEYHVCVTQANLPQIPKPQAPHLKDRILTNLTEALWRWQINGFDVVGA